MPTPIVEQGETPSKSFGKAGRIAKPFYLALGRAQRFVLSTVGILTVALGLFLGACVVTALFALEEIPLTYSGVFQADAELVLASGAIYVLAVELEDRRAHRTKES